MTYVSNNAEVASQRNVTDQDLIRDMVHNPFGVCEQSEEDAERLNEGVTQSDDVTPNVNKCRNVTDEFYKLSNDGQQPLYDG